MENVDLICLFVELFAEMVLIVDSCDGLDQKIIKISFLWIQKLVVDKIGD